jgi:hypothetical protein
LLTAGKFYLIETSAFDEMTKDPYRGTNSGFISDGHFRSSGLIKRTKSVDQILSDPRRKKTALLELF